MSVTTFRSVRVRQTASAISRSRRLLTVIGVSATFFFTSLGVASATIYSGIAYLFGRGVLTKRGRTPRWAATMQRFGDEHVDQPGPVGPAPTSVITGPREARRGYVLAMPESTIWPVAASTTKYITEYVALATGVALRGSFARALNRPCIAIRYTSMLAWLPWITSPLARRLAASRVPRLCWISVGRGSPMRAAAVAARVGIRLASNDSCMIATLLLAA